MPTRDADVPSRWDRSAVWIGRDLAAASPLVGCFVVVGALVSRKHHVGSRSALRLETFLFVGVALGVVAAWISGGLNLGGDPSTPLSGRPSSTAVSEASEPRPVGEGAIFRPTVDEATHFVVDYHLKSATTLKGRPPPRPTWRGWNPRGAGPPPRSPRRMPLCYVAPLVSRSSMESGDWAERGKPQHSQPLGEPGPFRAALLQGPCTRHGSQCGARPRSNSRKPLSNGPTLPSRASLARSSPRTRRCWKHRAKAQCRLASRLPTPTGRRTA